MITVEDGIVVVENP